MEYQADGGQVVRCSASGDDVVQLRRTVEGNILNITLLPSRPVRIARFQIRLPFSFQREDRILSNGFQSWTDTREYGVNERMRGYNRLTELYMKSPMAHRLGVNRAGDATFHAYPRGRGVCYGYSYGYVRRGNDVYLLGSLSERSGYTILTFDTRRDTIWVEKELEGVTFDRETQLLSLAAIEGTYDAVFDRYFEQMGAPKPRVGAPVATLRGITTIPGSIWILSAGILMHSPHTADLTCSRSTTAIRQLWGTGSPSGKRSSRTACVRRRS